jgi:hypothetical protein
MHFGVDRKAGPCAKGRSQYMRAKEIVRDLQSLGSFLGYAGVFIHLFQGEIFNIICEAVVLGLCMGAGFASLFSLFDSAQPYCQKWLANIWPALGYSVTVVTLGYCIGYLTASARSPDVGNLIPPIMTLIGGLSIYGFGIETKNKVIIGYCVFTFALVLLYGVHVGTDVRNTEELKRLISLSEIESQIRIYRENRSLPEDFPAWLGGSTK